MIRKGKAVRIIKIGGSLITEKDKPYTPREERMREIAAAVKRAIGNTFLIGHGGGSFPHTSAKKYRTKEGCKDSNSLLGAGIVHYDAVWINQLFMRALHEEGVPAISFHPNSFVVEGGELYTEPLEVAIEKGFIPVFHGDVVMDRKKGCNIYSTETIIYKLVKVMKGIKAIGMAEEVGGVYTADPKQTEDAELIERIDKSNAGEIMQYLSGSHGIDVTGGMKHKVEMLIELAKMGIDSYIFEGTPENVEAFLKGKKVRGTLITW